MTRWLTVALLFLSTSVWAEGERKLLDDTFAGKQLDEAVWERVRIHDTRADRITTEKGKLVLSLDTLGTNDKTVKLRGVRSKAKWRVPERGKLSIHIVLDWNGQKNGSYLTAGLALLPTKKPKQKPKQPGKPAKKKPEPLPHAAWEALAFEFVGVPPGKNARPYLWYRAFGGLRPLYTEGWPQPKREDRKGRPVGRVAITLELSAERVRLLENGRERYRGPKAIAGDVRLLLFVTGHSNYPRRTVLFESVKVTLHDKK